MKLSQPHKFSCKIAGILTTTLITMFAVNASADIAGSTLAAVAPSSRAVQTSTEQLPTSSLIVTSDGETKTTASLGQKDHNWQQARIDYQRAREMLRKRDFDDYLRLREKLTDYPLYPYLEYEFLRQHLAESYSKPINQFINTWSNAPLAGRLKYRWLKKLATSQQWQQYLDNYDDTTKSTELQCYALWAKHKTGNTENTFKSVKELWLVNHSQPNACDPIFDLWIKKDYLTSDMAWQRFEMVLDAGNTSLASYLTRFMTSKQQQLAKLAEEIYLHPERLETPSRFDTFNNKHRDIIARGFKRFARQNSLLAYQIWPQYQKIQSFDPAVDNQITKKIMLWLAHQDNGLIYQQALQRFPKQVDDDVLEAGIRLAVRQQNWPLVISLTNSLKPDAKNTTQSQYWLARAQLETRSKPVKTVRNNLKSISQERDYYSFLAADFLKNPYEMNNQHYSIDGNFLERFKQLPGIVRARELLKVKEPTQARREWYQATLGFDEDQHYAAAYHAQQIGWHSQAIRSAISAGRWHDLDLRFPLNFEQVIEEAAKARQLDSNWLFAMARQESALTPDAVSPAGARGLIQIMPGTARQVAKKHDIPYHSVQQLFDPNKNAELASAYLSSLLEQFNGNEIYATAAYNAGPNRVEQWLKTTRNLPIDVWIESIPYYETRQYVKNVLAYSVIYAHRRNQTNIQMATTNYLAKHNIK